MSQRQCVKREENVFVSHGDAGLIPADGMLRQGGELKDWAKQIVRICL